jgi:hypothetical protein
MEVRRKWLPPESSAFATAAQSEHTPGILAFPDSISEFSCCQYRASELCLRHVKNIFRVTRGQCVSLSEVAVATPDADETATNGAAQWEARIAAASEVLHDARGALFAARGYAKLILEERAGPVTVTQQRYLANILKNIDKLSLLTNALSRPSFSDRAGTSVSAETARRSVSNSPNPSASPSSANARFARDAASRNRNI